MFSDSCCCVAMYDAEPAKVYNAKMKKARKEHICSECGDKIKAGEEYEHVTTLWDDHWNTYKTCAFCLKIRVDFFHCGFYHMGMVEDFYECNGWDYRELPPDEDDDE